MATVCFFRHGPAVPHGTPGVAEDDRPLTPEGRKKTRAAARGVQALDLRIKAVLTSPLPRARETAEILAKELGLKAVIDERLRPGGDPAALAKSGRALVGHEPDFSAAVTRLIGGGAVELKKAGLAVVEDGVLKLLLTPAALRAIGLR